jgi:hypothetical protein
MSSSTIQFGQKPKLPAAHTGTLEVFDPAMCCSTGICGPDVDSKLVQFAADLGWLRSAGVAVQRHNLAQDPARFVSNPLVQSALAKDGESALPVILTDGRVVSTGRYPDRGELASLLGLAEAPANVEAASCCGGGSSCCGGSPT